MASLDYVPVFWISAIPAEMTASLNGIGPQLTHHVLFLILIFPILRQRRTNTMGSLNSIALFGIFCWYSVALTGCYPAYGSLAATFSIDSDAPRFERTPQMRVGSLLFPSYIWPLTVADPKDLGKHAYCPGPLPPLRLEETSRGIVYTRQAGFVDIAHIRNTMDLTYYAYGRLLAGLKAENTHLVLVGAEPSVYHIWITYPDWWKTLPSARKGSLIEQLSVRMAQRMSYLMMTWHEILTWYGYRPSLLISEKWSAFSCDDLPSHIIAAELAGPSLNLPEEQFEQAVTQSLSRRLAELEASEPENTRRAVELVKGLWWDWGKQDLVRRQVEVHLNGEAMNPWLIPALSNSPKAAILKLPTLDDITGYDCRAMIRVEIAPNVLEAYSIRDDLRTSESRIRPEQDFYRLAEHIRKVEAITSKFIRE